MAVSVGEIEATLRLRDEMSAKLKQAQVPLKEMAQILTALEDRVSEAGDAMKRHGGDAEHFGKSLDAANTATGKLSLGMVAMGTAIGTFIGSVAVKAVNALVSETIELVKRGAELAPVVQSFDALARSVGETSDAMLQAGRVGTKGLLTDMELMTAANKAINLGLPVTAKEFGTLTSAAVTLGRAMKQDAAKSVSDLVEGLGKGSPEVLNNLGIIVRAEDAYKSYAVSIGKSADELTAAERQTATYTAAMAAAEEKVQSLGGIHLTAADNVMRMKNQFTNLTDALSVAIIQSPALNEVFRTLADAIEGSVGTNQVDLVKRLTLYINELALSVVSWVGDMLRAAVILERIGAAAEIMTKPFGGKAADILFGDGTDLQKAADAIGPRIEELKARLVELRTAAGETTKGVDKLAGGPGGGGGGVTGLSDAMKKAAEAAKVWSDQVTGRTMARDLAELERRYTSIGGAVAMTSNEWMVMGKHLADMSDKGATLSPVLREIEKAYRLVTLQQQIGIDSNDDYVASIQRISRQLRLTTGDMTSLLNAKITPFDPAQLPGANINYDAAKKVPSNFGAGLAQSIMGAVQGGGNAGEAAGSFLGQSLGTHLAKEAGKATTGFFTTGLGSIVSASLPGIGALLGPLAGKFSSAIVGMFTGGAGAKANDLRDSLKAGIFSSIKGLENDPAIRAYLDQFNRAGNEKDVQRFADEITKSVKSANDAMARYGLSLDDVGDASSKLGRDTQRLGMDFDRLRGLGFSVGQIATGAGGQLNAMLSTALETGQKLPASMQPYIAELVRSGGLTDELKRKILGVADPVPWQQMEEAAKRYGISLDALGEKFQQAKLDDAAKKLAEDWKLLADNGADINAVMAGMKDEVQELISKALTLGLTIPESMRPLIEAMFRAGELVDENGDALEDLSRIEWAPDVLSDFDLLIEKIDELIDRLVDGLYPAINDIPSPSIPNTGGSTGTGGTSPNTQYDENGNPIDTAHTGGMATASGIRRHHRGTANVIPFPSMRQDEIPAILQSGEAILNRRAASSIGEASIRALNNGGSMGGGSVTNVYNNFDLRNSVGVDKRALDAFGRKLAPSLVPAVKQHGLTKVS